MTHAPLPARDPAPPRRPRPAPFLGAALALLLSGCASRLPQLPTVEHLDLNRFMGPWYVIACIPTFLETNAYNAVETYRLDADGSIDTVFTFN